MQLVFNELSLTPLAVSIQDAENNFISLLQTFKKAKENKGFKNILFQNNLSIQTVVGGVSFIQLLEMMINKDLKRSLITFLQPPYLDDLTEDELENFYLSEYQVIDEGCPTEEDPYGFPIAHIKSSPTISLYTHDFWRNLTVNLTRIGSEEDNNVDFSVCNICLLEDVESQKFEDWISVSMASQIADKNSLGKYLGYTKYTAHFEDNFFSQLMEWKKENQKLYKYTLALMKDVEIHPFNRGMGQTENLKNRGKEASKRITNSYPDGHRLSYIVEKNQVKFLACKGHYEFH